MARVPCVCQNCSHLYLHAFTNKWDLAAHPESYAVVLSSALKALQGWVGCQHHLGTCPSTVLKILHHGDVSAPAVNQINMPFLTEWTWQSSNMVTFQREPNDYGVSRASFCAKPCPNQCRIRCKIRCKPSFVASSRLGKRTCHVRMMVSSLHLVVAHT